MKTWKQKIDPHLRKLDREANKLFKEYYKELNTRKIVSIASSNTLWNYKYSSKLNKIMEDYNKQYVLLWNDHFTPKKSGLNLHDDGKPTFLSKIKKGEFFRFPHNKTVYVYDGKLTRGYFHYHKFDDYNHNVHTKMDRQIIIGFTF